jgi:hypothetical protein
MRAMTNNKDDLDALKARVAELERASKPAAPFTDPDWQPINPLDRLSMPRSAMLEMARACPDSFIKDIVGDHRAPQGPSGIVPSSQQLSNVRGTSGRGGWSNPIPLQNPPGTNYVDRLMDHQDTVDRQDRVVEEAQRRAMLKVEKPK